MTANPVMQVILLVKMYIFGIVILKTSRFLGLQSRKFVYLMNYPVATTTVVTPENYMDYLI